jgi:hypothetical protein
MSNGFIVKHMPATLSGYKAHIYCEDLDQVDIAWNRVKDEVEIWGWGAKLADDTFFDVIKPGNKQWGKGVTIYFPRRADWKSDLDHLVRLMAGRPESVQKPIQGDTYAGNGVSWRYEFHSDPGYDIDPGDVMQWYKMASTTKEAIGPNDPIYRALREVHITIDLDRDPDEHYYSGREVADRAIAQLRSEGYGPEKPGEWWFVTEPEDAHRPGLGLDGAKFWAGRWNRVGAYPFDKVFVGFIYEARFTERPDLNIGNSSHIPGRKITIVAVHVTDSNNQWQRVELPTPIQTTAGVWEDLAGAILTPLPPGHPNASRGYMDGWEPPTYEDYDWEAHLRGVREVYRGVGIPLSPEDQEWFANGGNTRSTEQTAEYVLSLVDAHRQSGVGTHWTSHRGEAAGFAGMTTDRGGLRVILTAETPSASQVMSGDELKGQGFFGPGDNEQEIPVKPGTPMRIKHVEWALGGPRPMLRSDDGGGWKGASPNGTKTVTAASFNLDLSFGRKVLPGVFHDPTMNGGSAKTLVEGGSRWGHGGFYATDTHDRATFPNAVYISGPFVVYEVEDYSHGAAAIWRGFSDDQDWNALVWEAAGITSEEEHKAWIQSPAYSDWNQRQTFFKRIAEILKGYGFDGVWPGGEIIIWKYPSGGHKLGSLEDHWDMSGDEPVWTQPRPELLRDALYEWKGSNSSLAIWMNHVLADQGYPALNGTAKIWRAQATAIIEEVRSGKDVPRLYRGDTRQPVGFLGWSENLRTARRFAKMGGGEVWVLAAGSARGIKISDYAPGSGLDHDEQEWIVETTPGQAQPMGDDPSSQRVASNQDIASEAAEVMRQSESYALNYDDYVKAMSKLYSKAGFAEPPKTRIEVWDIAGQTAVPGYIIRDHTTRQSGGHSDLTRYRAERRDGTSSMGQAMSLAEARKDFKVLVMEDLAKGVLS